MVKVLRSIVRGPLEPHVIGFADELLRQGYSRTSAAQHVCFLAHLDRWMSAEGIELDGLGGPVIERYLVQRRSAGYVEYRSVRALRPLLDFLAPLGVLPIPQEVPPGPVEDLLDRYRAYLVGERGLTSGTARGYVDFVRPFVVTRLRGEALDFAGLAAADVTEFVLGACPGRAVGSAKLIVCALRSLLRWLHLTGVVPLPLAAAVPSVAGWRLSGLPKGLEPGQLRRLLTRL
jgi:integrase/recombinase XerD